MSETVYTARGFGPRSTMCFHTDEECPFFPEEDNRVERDRETMEAWDWTECDYCSGDHPMFNVDDGHTQEKSLRTALQDEDDPIHDHPGVDVLEDV